MTTGAPLAKVLAVLRALSILSSSSEEGTYFNTDKIRKKAIEFLEGNDQRIEDNELTDRSIRRYIKAIQSSITVYTKHGPKGGYRIKANEFVHVLTDEDKTAIGISRISNQDTDQMMAEAGISLKTEALSFLSDSLSIGESVIYNIVDFLNAAANGKMVRLSGYQVEDAKKDIVGMPIVALFFLGKFYLVMMKPNGEVKTYSPEKVDAVDETSDKPFQIDIDTKRIWHDKSIFGLEREKEKIRDVIFKIDKGSSLTTTIRFIEARFQGKAKYIGTEQGKAVFQIRTGYNLDRLESFAKGRKIEF